MSFVVKQSSDYIKGYDVLLGVFILNQDASPLDYKFLSRIDFKKLIFSVKTQNLGIKSVENFIDSQGRIRIGIILKQDQKILTKEILTIIPYRTYLEEIAITLNPTNKQITLKEEDIPDKTLLEETEKSGDSLGKSILFTSTPAQYASIGSTAISFDPSGAIVQYTQATKFVTRARMINVKRGRILEEFIDNSAEKYDRPSRMSMGNIYDVQNGNKGKFDEKKSAFFT